MKDMLRSNTLVGGLLLNIVLEHLAKEPDVGVITYILSDLIPYIISDHVPSKFYCQSNHHLFETVLELLSVSDVIKDDQTKHLVIEFLIQSVRNEDHYSLMIKWFEDGTVSTPSGKQLEHLGKLSQKHLHGVM